MLRSARGAVGPTTVGTSHDLALTGLTSSTTYYLRVVATDTSGNTTTQDPLVEKSRQIQITVVIVIKNASTTTIAPIYLGSSVFNFGK